MSFFTMRVVPSGGSLPKNLIKTVVGRDIAVAALGPKAPEQKGMADLETGSF